MNQPNRPPTQTAVDEEIHPSTGKRAYSSDTRALVMDMVTNNPQMLQSQAIRQQQQQHTFPSNRTIQRWIVREQTLGHFLPFRRTGNSRAQREVNGPELIQLALYRAVNPKAYASDIAAYLFNAGLTGNRPLSDSQINRAEKKLNLTRKKGSTTSFKAYHPRNIALRRMYFHSNYPMGIADINTHDLIDIDECGIELDHSNRKFGKTRTNSRCDAAGSYENCLPKQNTLAAISGDNVDPMRWLEMWTGDGTTVFRFVQFVRRIINDLATWYPGRSFCFTMDNLNVHKNPLVIQEILLNGHRLVFRAPYWSVDGAIEYVFCTLHSGLLQRFNEIETMQQLEQHTDAIFHAMPSFTPYFEHIRG